MLESLTLDRVIALLASVGACLSAMAAFVSIRQSIIQRKLSYIPEIVTEPIKFSTKSELSFFDPNYFIEQSLGESLITNIKTVNLKNIGLGTAKSLQAEWRLPINSMIEKLRKSKVFSASDVKIMCNGNFLEIISNIENNKISLTINMKLNNPCIDFILPLKDEKAISKIRLPIEYLILSAAIINFELEEKDKNTFNLDIPKATLILTYFDISGIKIVRKFAMRLKIFAIMHTENSPVISGELTFNNIK